VLGADEPTLTAYIDANVGRTARAAGDPTLSRGRPIDGAFTVIVTVFPPRIDRPPPYPATARRARRRRPAADDLRHLVAAISRLDKQNNMLGTCG
jgi:hypothetical protein